MDPFTPSSVSGEQVGDANMEALEIENIELNAAKVIDERRRELISEALEHLASIDPIDLCNEAKIERCRATRDLSSCGRYVHHVLTSCGHASLCAECNQRCDICPICRTLIPNAGTRIRLRLYYKCIEAGLISKRHDERFHDKNENGGHAMADIQRLYSLFDVALENNLVSLICHYIIDVCMDETAVSSDPVLAFLLDEVVVKDWCKQTFTEIISELQKKYSVGEDDMKSNLRSFQKLALKLNGISNVLEVMSSSFKETFSEPVDDLQNLLECTLKAKQHLEIMIWCIRHQFLKATPPRYRDFLSWNNHFNENKEAATKRAWPDVLDNTDSLPFKPALFIEEALSNLGIGQTDIAETDGVDILCLQDKNSVLYLQYHMNEPNNNDVIAYYPFKNVRAAADILFLHGTSDMVVAKLAIFLYYLFDRHWTRPDVEWRHLIDDFAASFGISKQLVLESLTFYLLDDHTDESVQEAIHLLPEIACPDTHPKIAQVLLERQQPETALTVLRCSGHDGFSVYPSSGNECVPFVSLKVAITIIRVRIECGLITESFIYQRNHCLKVKELESRKKSPLSGSPHLESWVYRSEVLVAEICRLCIRRNIVDRLIELPWNSDEEEIIHKCLFDYASEDPASVCGSLLVVYYLQRYRYVEAYRVHHRLHNVEQKLLETADEENIQKIKSVGRWRTGLVEKSLELLPAVQKQEIVSTCAANGDISFMQDVQTPRDSDPSNISSYPNATLTPPSKISSLFIRNSFNSTPPKIVPPTNLISSTSSVLFELGKNNQSFLQQQLSSSLVSPASRMNTLNDGLFPNTYNDNHDFQTTPRRVTMTRDLQNGHPSKNTEVGLEERFQTHNSRILTEDYHSPRDMSYSNGLLKDSTPSTEWRNSHDHSNTWSLRKRDPPNEDTNNRIASIASRWRSDESSDDEADNGFERQIDSGIISVNRRRPRSLLR